MGVPWVIDSRGLECVLVFFCRPPTNWHHFAHEEQTKQRQLQSKVLRRVLNATKLISNSLSRCASKLQWFLSKGKHESIRLCLGCNSGAKHGSLKVGRPIIVGPNPRAWFATGNEQDKLSGRSTWTQTWLFYLSHLAVGQPQCSVY